MKTITIKEALEQGYEFCSIINDEWTSLSRIEDLTDDDFEEYSWWLASKESKNYQIHEKFLSELLQDVIASNEAEDSGRDDDAVFDAIGSLDYTEFTKMINEKLETFKYWTLGDTKIIQDEK